MKPSNLREANGSRTRPDLICFSHLRWRFVFQRPQHLITACSRGRRVLFVEEPIYDAAPARMVVETDGSILVATPHLPPGIAPAAETALLRSLLDEQIARAGFSRVVLWYYTPMAVPFSRHLQAEAVVYDCMDELSAFAGAPQSLRNLEQELLALADVVFTGGQSLYEAKRHLHRSVHAFPSSVDVTHFRRARDQQPEPDDQGPIARPRLGFYGVIDERMDLALIDGIAAARPGWQLVMLGPVVKISESDLPRRPNIHYLGRKTYEELPAYLAGWDVALLPFAMNEATRFISPTKTPEYLAAGLPVVSAPIRDVVRPYGDQGLVRIADGIDAFVREIEAALTGPSTAAAADALLQSMSWQKTWQRMQRLMDGAVDANRATTLRPDRAGHQDGLRPAL